MVLADSRTLSVGERGAAGASTPPAGRRLSHLSHLSPQQLSPNNSTSSTSQIMMGPYFALTFLLFNSVLALPQNFEDIDLASDQPDGEVEELIISCTE